MYKLFRIKDGIPVLVSRRDFEKVSNKVPCYLHYNIWSPKEIIKPKVKVINRRLPKVKSEEQKHLDLIRKRRQALKKKAQETRSKIEKKA